MDVQRMSDRELLVEVIGQEATRRFYKRSLAKLLQMGVPDLELRPLYAARELWERMLLETMTGREYFSSPDAVKLYLSLVYAPKTYEVFVVLFLDAQNCLIAAEEMFRGTLTQTSVYPREVVARALEHKAASVVLSHNHPSGHPAPSRADEMLTQTLKAALALVDVRVLDHIICGGTASMSMAERGLM